jgi:hypothetical protein
MTGPDPFETRFAAAYARYLDAAPIAVDAVEVARTAAHAHPRASAGGTSLHPGLAGRLAWSLLLAVLVAAFGAGLLVVGSWATRTSEVAPTMAPSPPVPAAGFTIGDLTGTWVGTVTVPGFDEQGGSAMTLDPAKDTTFAMTVTVAECAPGATCGSFSLATTDWSATGKAMSCAGSLTYRGPDEGGPAFVFEEKVATRSGAISGTSQAPICSNAILAMTPLASGSVVGVEEKVDVWLDYGVLVKRATP